MKLDFTDQVVIVTGAGSGIGKAAAVDFAEAGAIVEEAHPDLREAHECFHVLRAFDFAISKAALLRSKRDQLKLGISPPVLPIAAA